MKRLGITLAAALLVLSVRLFAAPQTLGQNNDNGESGTTITFAPTGLTNGSDMLIGVMQVGADVDQSYTVADGINTYTSRCLSPTTSNNRRTQIFSADNITTTAGALTIVVTLANGTATTRGQYVELLGTGAFDTSPTGVAEADAMAHTATTAITTMTDTFVYAAIAASGNIGTFTPPSGFTTVAVGNTSARSAYYTNATALSGNTLAWSGTNSTIAAGCAIAYSAGVAGAVVPQLSLLGVGR